MSDEEKTFSCVLCGMKLESKEALQEHFRGHANKSIDTKGRLTLPIPKRNNTKDPCLNTLSEKITCDVCPMEFYTVTQAIQHKFKKHPENSIKHFCQFCGMQFPLKFTKEKHVKSHKGMSTIGQFPCSECGVIFHNTQAQSYHFKSTHKRIMSIFKPVPTPPPSKKIKINNANEAQSVYYCYLCGMEYIIKFNLQKHLEASHNEEERNKVPENLIKCTTCDALFYNKKAYDNHNMYHRPDDLYVASEEQRLQTVSRIDQDFDIRRVQLVADKFIPIDKPKRRRQQSSIQAKSDKSADAKKLESDDELSPTSSIESSDSESETSKPKDKEPTNDRIEGKPHPHKKTDSDFLNKIIPGNSKQSAVIVEKVINADVFFNIPTKSNKQPMTSEHMLVKSVNQIISTQSVEHKMEQSSEQKIMKSPSKKSHKKEPTKKFKSPPESPTKRSLRNNKTPSKS